MPASRKYNMKNDQTKGWIYLYKNEKVIRDRPFNSRSQRRKFLNEFIESCTIGSGHTFYIDIKLEN
jgi:hypothetical protein